MFAGSSRDCGVVLSNPTGWFSPRMSYLEESYENNLNCTWTLTAPIGMGIEIVFDYILLEEDVRQVCDSDFLQVW